MYFVNHLTDDDFQRVHDIMPRPAAGDAHGGVVCCVARSNRHLHAGDRASRHVRNAARSPTGRRSFSACTTGRSGFCRTAIELKSVIHQQSLTSAERSVIELYVDMELVHRNAIPDAVAKVIAFGDSQKLKAARRMDKFFTDNPGLDKQPSKATAHRAFIASEEQRIVQTGRAALGRECEARALERD